MKIHTCRHIRINGDRCGSPALADRALCYYHDRAHRRHHDTVTAQHNPTRLEHTDGRYLDPAEVEYYAPVEGPLKLELPPLEDLDSIQFALSLLITAMAQNRIAPSRAGRLIYALQLASANARVLMQNPVPFHSVTETTLDEHGLDLAPEDDLFPSPELTPETLHEEGAGQTAQPLPDADTIVQITAAAHHHAGPRRHDTQAAHVRRHHCGSVTRQHAPARHAPHCPGSG